MSRLKGQKVPTQRQSVASLSLTWISDGLVMRGAVGVDQRRDGLVAVVGRLDDLARPRGAARCRRPRRRCPRGRAGSSVGGSSRTTASLYIVKLLIEGVSVLASRVSRARSQWSTSTTTVLFRSGTPGDCDLDDRPAGRARPRAARGRRGPARAGAGARRRRDRQDPGDHPPDRPRRRQQRLRARTRCWR